MIEAPGKCGDRKRFAFAAQVVACVLHRAARTVKRGLTGFEVRGQADGRKIGQCDRSAGNAAAAVDDFKTKSVGKLIAFCFVYLHENIFAGLRRDLAFGIDLRPIEDAGMVVEIAAGSQQIRFGERLIRLDGCDVVVDQALLGVDAAERQDVAR